MAIVGIGTDVVQLSRIQAMHETYGVQFAQRILTANEMKQYEGLAQQDRRIALLAKRFALKEAVVKAMGTGFVPGFWLKDVGFEPNHLGKPQVVWSERGALFVARLGIERVHVSVSDERDVVLAFAVAEAA